MLIMRILYNVMRKKRQKIAICMGLTDYYEHGIARGIVRYAKQKEEWELFGYGWMFGGIDDLHDWQGDGIITRAESPADAAQLSELEIPVIDVAGAYIHSGFHQVVNDDFRTGQKAGAYLKNCGFTNLAFCGVEKVAWSEKRFDGFTKGCGTADTIPLFERPLTWWENLSALEDRSSSGSLNEWLSALPRPCGIFACNDTAGVKIAGICRKLGILVPEEIAVLGVDNEDILCELSNPSLTSIQLDCEEIGFRAAELLDTLLLRDEPERQWLSEIQIPPGELIERETTRVFVCENETVREAVDYIRRNFNGGIRVDDVASQMNTSRRNLEIKFRKYLSRTVNSVLLDAKMTYIRKQLVSTDKTMELIAEESGYATLQRFHAAFKKAEGTTPGSYRKQNRRG